MRPIPRSHSSGRPVSSVDHPLKRLIDDYNDAVDRPDVEAIVAMHAPGMVFENHTAGERAEGEQVGPHIARIFESWPDLHFQARRMYIRDDLVVQEWTASATHSTELRRGSSARPRAVAASSGTGWTSSPSRAV